MFFFSSGRGPEARDELAVRYGLSREQLVDAFGSARDHWIETDFQGWLGANKFYEVLCESSFFCSICVHSRRFFLGATVCSFGPVNGVYWSVVRWKVGELGLSRTFGAGSVTLEPSFGIMFGLKNTLGSTVRYASCVML